MTFWPGPAGPSSGLVASLIEPGDLRHGAVLVSLFSFLSYIGLSGSTCNYRPLIPQIIFSNKSRRGANVAKFSIKLALLHQSKRSARPMFRDSIYPGTDFRVSGSSSFLSLCESWPPSSISSLL